MSINCVRRSNLLQCPSKTTLQCNLGQSRARFGQKNYTDSTASDRHSQEDAIPPKCFARVCFHNLLSHYYSTVRTSLQVFIQIRNFVPQYFSLLAYCALTVRSCVVMFMIILQSRPLYCNKQYKSHHFLGLGVM